MEGGKQPSINELLVLRLVTNVGVASRVISIWDYIITFGMEVDHVWKSNWGFVKVLYLLQRYLPFFDTAWLTLYVATKTGLTKTTCQRIYIVSGAMGYTASETILTLRTWAVWDRDRRLSIILPSLYVLLWFPSYVIDVLFVKSMKFGDPPYPGFQGCFLTQSMNIKHLTFSWVLMAFWDTLMLVLILAPTIREYRSGGALMKVVYRDDDAAANGASSPFIDQRRRRPNPSDSVQAAPNASDESAPLDVRKPCPASYSRSRRSRY
ncbi:hypothetical protein M413DRAFT_31325 [Hebeloma cylindrosporum]|uniref:DUF6533 domain-containing protein n=1 Tax=Hebeloma cylindrosporum TaxID=76867 RepID=A0A0C3BZR2_HEBCY|nr:hypothetical protein M413DRAFT_31325 [Hebeloma cylindrosporum h7]